MVDLNGTTEIKVRRAPLIKATIGFSVIFICSVVFASGYVESPPKVLIASWVAIPLFGVCLAPLFWQLATSVKTIVLLSPDGLCDIRYGSNVIPWSSIQHVGAWSEGGQSGIIVSVQPLLKARLGSSAADKLYRTPRRSILSKMPAPKLADNEIFVYMTPLALDEDATIADIEARMRLALGRSAALTDWPRERIFRPVETTSRNF